MYVSRESSHETTRRLQLVLARAELRVFEGPYAFAEYPIQRFPESAIHRALAIVRDDHVWSALVPAEAHHAEQFTLFSFHFAAGIDNSGFVGWLASELKANLGTGVFVVCGQNTNRGGIFDYWGVPVQLGERVLSEVKRMRYVASEA
jgi:hypothetical protein